MLRFWLIVASLVSALIFAWAIVTYLPQRWIDFALIAFAAIWQVIFETTGWVTRPQRRLLRIAFKIAAIAAFAWFLYPWDVPFRG